MPKRDPDDEKISAIAQAIMYLDDIRAFKRHKIEEIDSSTEALKNYGFDDISKEMHTLKPMITQIVEMPYKIPGAIRRIRFQQYLRLTNRILLIAMVALLGIVLTRVWRENIGVYFGPSLVPIFISVAIITVISINLESILDYLLRKKIVRYEAENEHLFERHRKKLKEGVEKATARMIKEIKRADKDTEDYAMYLFYDDYLGFRKTGSHRPRSMILFKKKFSVHTMVPGK